MNFGRMRHKASIQRAVESRDASGGVTLAWQTYRHAWISFEIDSGSEGINSERREGAQRVSVAARYVDGVKTTDRLVLNSGRVFEIVAAFDPDGRRSELRMICKEVLNRQAAI